MNRERRRRKQRGGFNSNEQSGSYGSGENFADDDEDDSFQPGRRSNVASVHQQITRMSLKARNRETIHHDCKAPRFSQAFYDPSKRNSMISGSQVEAKLENFSEDSDKSASSGQRYEYRKESIVERREGRSRDRRSLYDIMQRQRNASNDGSSGEGDSRDSAPNGGEPGHSHPALPNSWQSTAARQPPKGRRAQHHYATNPPSPTGASRRQYFNLTKPTNKPANHQQMTLQSSAVQGRTLEGSVHATEQEDFVLRDGDHFARRRRTDRKAQHARTLGGTERETLRMSESHAHPSSTAVDQPHHSPRASLSRGLSDHNFKTTGPDRSRNKDTRMNTLQHRLKQQARVSGASSIEDESQSSSQPQKPQDGEKKRKYLRNAVDIKQFNTVDEYMRSLQVRTSRVGGYQDDESRPKKHGRTYSRVRIIRDENGCARHSVVSQVYRADPSPNIQYSQSTAVDQKFQSLTLADSNWHQQRMARRQTQGTEYRCSLGGKSTASVKIKQAALSAVDDEGLNELEQSIHSDSLESQQGSDPVYESKFASPLGSPSAQEKEAKKTVEEPGVEEPWKILKFYDEPDFDPVHYLSQRIIKCKKYNYSIPESFGSSMVVLKYTQDTDSLDIYNVDHLVNKSDQDDGQFIIQGGKRLDRLDKLIKSVRMKDVKSFIYGPFSTRFYMMRMGINQLIVDNSWKSKFKKEDIQHLSKEEQQQLKTKYGEWQNCLPFFAWNCITLQLDDRDIDLVFFDDQSVKIFILFLIIKLDTYNGIRNSITSLRKQNVIKQNIPTKVMMQKIFFNFFVMKVRMKMSFEACVQHRTLKELLLLCILKTYEQRNKDGLVKRPYPAITSRMLHRIRNLCFRGLTYTNIQKDKAEKPETPHQHKHEKGQKEQAQDKNLVNFLQQTLLSRDNIDDLFQQHFETDYSEDDDSNNLYVKQADWLEDQDNAGGTQTTRMPTYNTGTTLASDKNEQEPKLDDAKIQKKSIEFKRKFERTEKYSLYSKIMLLVKLRVLKGPLFIYAILECIKLSRSILILELQLGKECVIPYEFNIKQYPFSFQYYDCLIEVIGKHFEPVQKKMLQIKHQKKKDKNTKIYQNLTKKNKQSIAKEKKASVGEKIGRELKSFFSKDDMQDPRKIRQKEYKSYIRLFNKAENIQNARYIELNKHQLRRTHLNGPGNEELLDANLEEQDYGLRCLSYSTYEDLGKFDSKNKIQAADLHVDLNYITNDQVGRKRQDLFVKKVLYQNQLTALKQKGKRLLMCERLDGQTMEQTDEFLNKIEQMRESQSEGKDTQKLANKESSKEFSDEDLRSFMLYLDSFQEAFHKKSVIEQEDTVIRQRAKLIKGILSRRNFTEINNYIDNKIKYDQRFFQKGYAEYQAFMSDIRKQITLNEQIIRLKANIKKLQVKLDKKNQALLSSFTISASKDKQNEEYRTQNRLLRSKSGNHIQLNSKILLNRNSVASNRSREKSLSNQNDGKSMIDGASPEMKIRSIRIQKLGAMANSRFYEQEERQMDDEHSFQENLQEGQKVSVLYTDSASQFESIINTPPQQQHVKQMAKQSKMSKQSQISHLHRRKKTIDQDSCGQDALSYVDSSYPSLKDENDSSKESIDLLHNNIICNLCDHRKTLSHNKLYDRMKLLALSSANTKYSEMNNNLFQRLAHTIKEADESCPISQEINQLKNKIVRKRARIHLVQTDGQKTLWGKDGSYEPAHVFHHKCEDEHPQKDENIEHKHSHQ